MSVYKHILQSLKLEILPSHTDIPNRQSSCILLIVPLTVGNFARFIEKSKVSYISKNSLSARIS